VCNIFERVRHFYKRKEVLLFSLLRPAVTRLNVMNTRGKHVSKMLTRVPTAEIIRHALESARGKEERVGYGDSV